MKKMTTTEQRFCDCCKNPAPYSYQCDNCGNDHCFACSEKVGKKYSHDVGVGGSGDAYYCLSCDALLSACGDPRWKAYSAIRILREENKAWYESFERRRKEAARTVQDFVLKKRAGGADGEGRT